MLGASRRSAALPWPSIAFLGLLLGGAAWWFKGRPALAEWRVGRIKKKAEKHHRRYAELLLRAKHIAEGGGLSPQKIAALTKAAKTPSEAVSDLEDAIHEKEEEESDKIALFKECVGQATRLVGERTGKKGSRPKNAWRKAYDACRETVRKDSPELELPASDTKAFRELLKLI